MRKTGIRLLLLFTAQSCFNWLYGQEKDSSNLLPSFTRNSVRYHTFSTGFKYQYLDSSLLEKNSQNNLSSLLSANSPIFIKSYGPSGLSTPSFRGSNAGQTPVIWNGFNLQSPFNGQVDFATIPAFMAEEIAIQYGSPSALFGSGAIGGAVHLSTRKNIPAGVHGKVLAGGGSYGMFTTGAQVSFGNSRLSVSEKIYRQTAVNNFRYQADNMLQPASQSFPKGAVTRMKHAEFETDAWLQEFKIKMGKNQHLAFSSWLQQNKRNFPTPVNSADIKSNQKDQTIRITGEYINRIQKYELQIRQGYFHDYLLYRDINTPGSDTRSNQFITYIDNFWNQGNYLMQISTMVHFTSATGSDFIQTYYRNRMAVYGSLRYSFPGSSLTQHISLRQEWVSGSRIPLVPAYGLSYPINSNFNISGNYSHSYSLPTLNDLYWPKMGNPDLKPQEGKSGELTLRYFKSFKSRIFVITGLTAYSKLVKNWIIWLPSGNNLSTPSNVYKVWSRGLEANWTAGIRIRKVSLQISGLHDLTLSSNRKSTLINDASINRQLIYTPRIKHTIRTNVKIRKITLNYTWQYTGVRFVTSDNSSWLNPYTISTLSINRSFEIKQREFIVDFLIQNLSNQSYQVFVNQPMPLRNFQFSITYKF